VWLIWASVSAHRPRAGTGDLSPILASGFVLLGLLVFLALLGTISAFKSGTLVRRVAPTPQPSFANPN
jgi:hypothetical protein